VSRLDVAVTVSIAVAIATWSSAGQVVSFYSFFLCCFVGFGFGCGFGWLFEFSNGMNGCCDEYRICEYVSL